MTVLFADLVEFTALSRQLDAEDVRSVVNSYFSCWREVIELHGGVVEKFIGDAVMAVFGLHRAMEDDPHRAIRTALAMKSALEELNTDPESEYGITLQMRVGIDTGEVVVSMDRPDQEVSVVGETVNLASRLQAEAPNDGVLISGDTHRHVRGGFSFRSLGTLSL
ncbi:MAG TPA: adenylate/guanylate cyclase domain-containing protein [Acidimicrobiia bacterium]|nr:adenylate/guanylate cyclase domain-containing protein [Acidimicrobiia bacterium]